MRFLSFAAALPLLSLTSTAPLEKRALSDNDVSVLKLANTLEYLENTLYTGGYYKFSDADYTAAGFPAGFRDNVGVIASHEKIHAAELSSVLSSNGVAPPRNCTFQFNYTDPKSFVALANMITTVGIGAYLGGGQLLADNTTLLGTASSILTNEARHDAYLRTGAGASPFPTPYDTSLTAVWAYSLASMFIVSCPDPLNITPLPKLMASPMPPPNLQPPTPAGATITFTWDPSTFFVKVDPSKPLYIAWVNQISPPVFEQVQSTGPGSGTAKVPDGVGGVAFAVLTTFSGGLDVQQLSQFGTLAGPAEVALA